MARKFVGVGCDLLVSVEFYVSVAIGIAIITYPAKAVMFSLVFVCLFATRIMQTLLNRFFGPRKKG